MFPNVLLLAGDRSKSRTYSVRATPRATPFSQRTRNARTGEDRTAKISGRSTSRCPAPALVRWYQQK